MNIRISLKNAKKKRKHQKRLQNHVHLEGEDARRDEGNMVKKLEGARETQSKRNQMRKKTSLQFGQT